MQVHRDINNLPSFNNAVITIGTFDGVHTGHLQVIHQLKEEAKKTGGETVIITFDPHPRMVISGEEHDIKLLNTLQEKTELFQKHEIDHLVVVTFTKEFSDQPAEKYLKDFIIDKFHPHTIITGHDHHFGKQRKGNYKLLEGYASELNYKLKEIPGHVLNQITISSTKIRTALLHGDLETANKYLGYNYFFTGHVVDGKKIGRTLGYPTANLEITDTLKLIPSNGIYLVRISIDNIISLQKPLYKGMMSIGVRPTIGGTERVIEVNIFDFDKDIYGKNIMVSLEKYVREEQKFAGLEELKTAMADDKKYALKYFNEE